MKILPMILIVMVSASSQAAISLEMASKIAKAYAIGVDRNIEKLLDGETLDQALRPKAPAKMYEFVLQDTSDRKAGELNKYHPGYFGEPILDGSY